MLQPNIRFKIRRKIL